MIPAAERESQNGGDGREFDDRTFVERHFGKHTGLPPSAKACPKGHVIRKPAARLVQVGPSRHKQRQEKSR
jgi:hypothetical protein